MNDTSPLRSLTIDPVLLRDHASNRPRPPSNKVFSLITTKNHPTLPLSVHNYNNKSTFLRKEWDDLGLAARTLVTETTTGKVVSRSLPKFFNYHEKHAYKPTGRELAFAIEEKVDGSLISLFWYRDEWMFISRTSFESTHALSARRILDKHYPGALRKLDKQCTYVFELVDPKMPIKVVYTKEDLVILSIVSKNGEEPPFDFDWNTVPFSRPRKHSAPTVSPNQLSKLNFENEEGFVVKFWATPEDRYPKRIKVKFESYLEVAEGLTNSMSRLSTSSSPIVPSNARILEVYSQYRLKIQHFKSAAVANTMERNKGKYLETLQAIADDYGGAPWLRLVEKIWDRIDVIFTLKEGELKEMFSSLQREGYIPNPTNARSQEIKRRFERRIKRNGIDQGFRESLMSWFLAEPNARQVEAFVKQLEFPADLRFSEVIGRIKEF